MSSQNTNTPSKALVDQLEKAIKAIDSKKHEEAQSLLDTLSLSCRELGDTQIQSVTQKIPIHFEKKENVGSTPIFRCHDGHTDRT